MPKSVEFDAHYNIRRRIPDDHFYATSPADWPTTPQAEFINALNAFLLDQSAAPKAMFEQPEDSSVLKPEIRARLPVPICAAIDGHQPAPEMAALEKFDCALRRATVEAADADAKRIVYKSQRWYRSGVQRTEVKTTMGPMHYYRSCYRRRGERQFCPLTEGGAGCVNAHV